MGVANVLFRKAIKNKIYKLLILNNKKINFSDFSISGTPDAIGESSDKFT